MLPSDLPEELWLTIFNYLPAKIITTTVRRVCKQWYFFSYDFFFKEGISLSITREKLEKLNFCALVSCKNSSFTSTLLISDNDILTDAMLEEIVRTHSNIRSLSLTSCKKISDKGIKCIADLKQLQSLTIKHLSNISNESIVYLSKRVYGLENLVLIDSCSCLTDDSLIAIGNFKNLIHLNISFECLTNASDTLAQMSKSLEYLQYFDCRSNNFLCSCFHSMHFRRLTMLVLEYLSQDADEGLANLVENTETLRCLQISYSPISGKFINAPHNIKDLQLKDCRELCPEFYNFFRKNIDFDRLDISINSHCDLNLNFPNVKQLCLILNEQIFCFTEDFSKYAFLNAKHLVKLTIYSIRKKFAVDQSFVETVFSICQNLETLCIVGIHFSNPSNFTLQKNLSIRDFRAHLLQDVGEAVMEKIAIALPNLLKVKYGGKHNFVPIFQTHCKYLKESKYLPVWHFFDRYLGLIPPKYEEF